MNDQQAHLRTVPTSDLFTLQEAAEYCRLPVNTLRWYRASRTGPKSGKIGARVMYRKSDLDQYIGAAFDSEGT